MNILGINGSIGWDGNCSTDLKDLGEMWVHGSGATLVMDGVLKNAINEERFSRIKYDGCYPKLAIQNILEYNELTNNDINLVVWVGNNCLISLALREEGYIENKFKEYFPNCKVEFLSHHMAHSAATFYTSGFDESNILSFDGAGDHVRVGGEDGSWTEKPVFKVPHFMFSQGVGLTINEITLGYINDPYSFLGASYGFFSALVYNLKITKDEDIDPLSKAFLDSSGIQSLDTTNLMANISTDDRETFPGKVMGLAAYGDYNNINLPDSFKLDSSGSFPILYNSPEWEDNDDVSNRELLLLNPEDLAAWSQHQFEKHLLNYLRHIPKEIKRDNLCLGGGCALNILANTKILEEGIYKNVHVNTAPNDDGLHFGAALYKAVEYENKIILPDDIGYLGIQYTDKDIEKALC
jgi:carbamoyltransferase